MLSPKDAAGRQVQRGHTKAARAILAGSQPLPASEHLAGKGFVPTPMGPPQEPVAAIEVDAFDPVEMAVAVKGLKAVGAGPSGLRPTLLALALVGPAMMRASAKVCTQLLCDRPAWVFRTRPLVVSKEGGGVRVIEMAEPLHHLLELLVMQRCAAAPVQDVAAMAVITRARVQRGDALVVADIKDGFNAVPHEVLMTWARLRPEFLVSA